MTAAPAAALLQAADTHLSAGRPGEALPLYDHAVAGLTDPAQQALALNNRGLAREALGDLPGADGDWQAALTRLPALAPALGNAARAALALDRPQQALDLATRALAVAPQDAGPLWARASALLALGHASEAVSAAEAGLHHYPDLLPLALVLGAALVAANRAEEAVSVLTPLAASLPRDGALQDGLGCALRAAGHIQDALAAHHRATTLLPDVGEVWINLGATHLDLHQPQAALAALDRAVSLLPDSAPAHDNRGLALAALQDWAGAAAAHRRAHALAPDQAGPLLHLGAALRQGGAPREAMAALDQGLTLAPGDATGHNDRGLLWRALGQWQRAAEDFALAARAAPDDPGMARNLGVALYELHRPEEAAAAFATMRALGTLDATGESTWLYYQVYGPDTTAAGLRAAHETVAARLPTPSLPATPHTPETGPLRLGFLSPEFRYHATLWFVADLFRQLDRQRVTVQVFDLTRDPDGASRTLRPLVDHWQPLAHLPESRALATLTAARPHVLVDLAGHMRHTQPWWFKARLAPVQVAWLGYPATTGLGAMDYWLTDRVLHPDPGPTAVRVAEATETVWRLDRCWVAAAPPETLPALAPRDPGPPVFGYLGTLRKVHPPTLALWARVLRAVPEAPLLLDTPELDDPALRAWITEGLGAHGIAPERLTLGSTARHEQVLARYGAVDVVLDSLPATGGTSTLEALWMGVPVVTLAGHLAVHRQSASLLTHAGWPHWVAATAEQYVAIAVALAREVATGGPATDRNAVRTQVLTGPLADTADHARALEQACRAMYTRH